MSLLLTRTPALVTPSVAFNAVLLASALLLAPSVQAQPQHDCERPERPEQFESKDQGDQFFESAREYLDCLVEFFEEQAEVSRLAAEAANAAREERQDFANTVNN